ncbi:MAG TPA: NHL repeat-containing protein [Candidatus Polarisedimenticolaceae bacterium]|nr:NHL repeat-containing protein [Candidatus Polarisedimenticolaceae bacterium]
MRRRSRHVLWLASCIATGGLLHGTDAVRLRAIQVIHAGPASIGLAAPEGVACGDGRAWIADTGNGRLVELTAAADGYVATSVVELPELARPQRVRLAADGSFFVLDGRQRRIGRVDRSGSFLGWVDPSGAEPLGRVVPRGFDLGRDGRLYILDIAGRRVLVTDAAGRVERRIGFAASAAFLSDVAVDPRGTVFAVDSVGRRLFRAPTDASELSPLSETLEGDLDFPTDLTADPLGRLLVSDRHGGGIVIVGFDGSFRGRQSSMGWRPGMLRYPSGLCVNGNGELFVADTGNNRVQVFRVVE